MSKDDLDRLTHIEKLLEKKEDKGNRLCWIRWNPNSKIGYEINDAREDIQWMIHEIHRLKGENIELKKFAENFRKAIEKDIRGI